MTPVTPVFWSLKRVKRLVITIIGLMVLGVGIAMIVLPGPAVIVIPVGLGILATEFVWARRLLQLVKERLPRRITTRTRSSS